MIGFFGVALFAHDEINVRTSCSLSRIILNKT